MILDITTKQDVLAQFARQDCQSVRNTAIQVADSAVILPAGHYAAFVACQVIFSWMHEFGRIMQRHAFGAFQKDCVVNQRVAETDQFQINIGWVITGGDREIRARQMRGRPDSAGQIADKGQMGHFLDRDAGHGPFPVADDFSLFRGKAVLFAALQAPNSVEVAAHDVVLDSGSLGKHVDQFFAILDANFRLLIGHKNISLHFYRIILA